MHEYSFVSSSASDIIMGPKEHPVGLDDRQVEGRVVLKSWAETRLCELIDSHLP